MKVIGKNILVQLEVPKKKLSKEEAQANFKGVVTAIGSDVDTSLLGETVTLRTYHNGQMLMLNKKKEEFIVVCPYTDILIIH